LKTIAVALAAWPGWLTAWVPGTYPAGSCNFTVDAQNRNDVVAFWHGVYQASEGYQDRHGWTGNYGNYDATPTTPGAEGLMSPAFVTDVERRLNFFRALCGVPSGARLNTGATVLTDAADLHTPAAGTTKATAAQQAAYMAIRTYGYSLNGVIYPPLGSPNDLNAYEAGCIHEPLQAKCVAWTAAAWNANHNGNVGHGSYGPGAIDYYLGENATNSAGVDNIKAGHRRWALYPPATNYASGDTPGSYDPNNGRCRPPSNVLYVSQSPAETAIVTARFVAYPAAGYFPAPLNTQYWSLSYPNAVFTSATVKMTTASGDEVSAEIMTKDGAPGPGQMFSGDPALVWKVSGATAATSVSTDTTYNVTVAGMTGTGVPCSYSYSVTLINPNQVTSDQCLFGASMPPTTAATTYQFTPPSKAEAIQVNCFQPVATAWTEGAEDSPESKVIANTASTYVFRSTANFSAYPPPNFGPITGAKSFRLAIPVLWDPRLNGVPEQWFELGRDFLPAASAKLNFKYRRGYMTSGTSLAVETSSDGGVTWAQVTGGCVTGKIDAKPDVAPLPLSLSLAASSVPMRIRFRLYASGFFCVDQYDYRNNYDFKTLPNGIFIDDISTTNCPWLDLKKTNELAATATSLDFNSSSAGVALTNNLDLRLRLRTKLGNRWMPYGPMKGLTLNSSTQTTCALNPAGGTYAAGQAITLSGESGSTIHYRLNGGTEQSAASPFSYSVPAYPATLTIIAYATKGGKADSAVVSATYRSQEPTEPPAFDPPGGEYAAGQAITLTGESGSTIHYRLNDGTEQSAASPVCGIAVPAYPASLTITAYATKSGKADSAVVSATYTSQEPMAPPTFDPPGGEYAAGQVITLTGESGSTLFYRLNGGAELSAASPFSGISVPADCPTLALTAYASKSGKSASASVSTTYTRSQFKTWMNTYYPGIKDLAIVGSTADPDRDGQANFVEFALGGNPSGAGSRGRVYSLVSNDDGGAGEKTLLLTIAVRAGTPAFTGLPSPAATQDGVTYRIQGGLGIGNFTSPVSEVDPVITGLPAVPPGYEYRSFQLDATEGLPARGFLRVGITTLP
jgi:hypothetical protein